LFYFFRHFYIDVDRSTDQTFRRARARPYITSRAVHRTPASTTYPSVRTNAHSSARRTVRSSDRRGRPVARPMHSPSTRRAPAVAATLMAVATLLQCATPVTEAAVSPARRHDGPGRHGPMAADQPTRGVNRSAAADEYDDANYDDPDYEDNGNYRKRLPDAAEGSRTINMHITSYRPVTNYVSVTLIRIEK